MSKFTPEDGLSPCVVEDGRYSFPHTPGPWYYSSGAVWADMTATVGIAQRISDSPICPANRDSNLRLCAAAPELLEALKDLVHTLPDRKHMMPGMEAAFEDARAAIAKAEGK